jgi:hypothetical protein
MREHAAELEAASAVFVLSLTRVGFKTVTYVCSVLVFPQDLLIQIFSLLLPPVPHVYQNGLGV